MHGPVPKLLLMSLLGLFSSMNVRASGLHPLREALPEAELRVTLRNAARPNEEVVVECDYKARRERDVRKERSLHLVDILPWRIGSNDTITVNREEANRRMYTVRAIGTTLTLTVPLRHPDSAYRGFQLARMRVGNVEFERWFAEMPPLDSGFGLQCSTGRLGGNVRLGGLGAAPLNGSLPLWPELREVDLDVSTAVAPEVRLWDVMTKHHWDGWRQGSPEEWHGGATTTARHIDGPAVWRFHEYYSILPADAPAVTKPAPPAGVLPGVGLEVYWPAGDSMTLPDAFFERPAAVLALRAARLTLRAKELLARSVETRPGLEMNSLSAEEWRELEALVDETVAAPVEFAMRDAKNGGGVSLQRLALNEAWIYLFGVEYDSDRRYRTAVLYLSPSAWTGLIPE